VTLLKSISRGKLQAHCFNRRTTVKDYFPSALATPYFSRARAADYCELIKPRITVLVAVTTLAGFYIGARGEMAALTALHTVVGTMMAAGGAGALNMYLERDLDALMRRTRRRPLPSGRLQPGETLYFAAGISGLGVVYLLIFVNTLTSLLAVTTLLSYLFLYTPLKKCTWLCTLVGAVPGALPAPMGWAAATGSLSWGAWVLFGILYFWQLPHFYAIGWIYREDYARAGFSMLSVVDQTGRRSSRQSWFFIGVLILVTTLPALLGLAGPAYLFGALALGIPFLAHGILFARWRSELRARRLFVYSVCYLPCLLLLMVLDKVAR
jgi:protoheme IX farnesyltransferase